MQKTITIDDLTGLPSETTREVSVLFDDQAYTLDLAPESVDALTALFANRDAGKLWDLLTSIAVTAEVVDPKPAPATEPTGKEINVWLKSTGRPVKRGNPSKELKEEYLAAHR